MKKRIVCIDDDPAVLHIVKAVLEATNAFEVFPFRLANEAINRVTDIKPDLILLDVVMSVMNGVSTIKVLKASDKRKDFPVVFLTARSQMADIKHYMELGALGVIPKPVDINDFVQQVEKFCGVTSEHPPASLDSQKIADMLSGLRKQYAVQLKERQQALNTFLAICEQGTVTSTQCAAVYGHVHSLIGSGKTYGFPDISDTARKLEEALKNNERDSETLIGLTRPLLTACDQVKNQL